MSHPIDVVRDSLPNADLLELGGIEESEEGIVLQVRNKKPPRCLSCSSLEVSHHSTYTRHLRDLPWQGRPVRIQFKTRRFRCLNQQCPHQIFAESLPGVAARRARETDRFAQSISMVGYLLGGRPGSHLMQRLGMKVSRDTVLRRVKTWSAPATETKVRVLGVDDCAWRKHQGYGTMLMDLEQRRVIDLLPVRSTASFADWLRQHPGVEIIARDRCGLYAEGGHEGSPSAVQVTDRYHLMSNLSEAVEHTLQQLQIEARAELAPETSPKPSRKLTLVEVRYQRCRQARYERYLAVVELGRQGDTQLAIAAKLGMRAQTVARWLRAPTFPERRIRRDRRRDQARFLQDRARGLHPALPRTQPGDDSLGRTAKAPDEAGY
ncbi:MAG: ISL3 family transposase [Terriglobia bacterium]